MFDDDVFFERDQALKLIKVLKSTKFKAFDLYGETAIIVTMKDYAKLKKAIEIYDKRYMLWNNC